MMEVTKDSSETVLLKYSLLWNRHKTINQKQKPASKNRAALCDNGLDFGTLIYFDSTLSFGLGLVNQFLPGLVMMISASPCALAASAVPASLSAISNLAKRGILFKGSSYLANMGQTKVAAFDKTGTLTIGQPQVTDVFFAEETTEAHRQEWVSLILAMEKQANHPLAAAIVEHFEKQEKAKPLELSVNNQIGSGLTAVVEENLSNWQSQRRRLRIHHLLSNEKPWNNQAKRWLFFGG